VGADNRPKRLRFLGRGISVELRKVVLAKVSHDVLESSDLLIMPQRRGSLFRETVSWNLGPSDISPPVILWQIDRIGPVVGRDDDSDEIENGISLDENREPTTVRVDPARVGPGQIRARNQGVRPLRAPLVGRDGRIPPLGRLAVRGHALLIFFAT
jgi:hypothetical protein